MKKLCIALMLLAVIAFSTPKVHAITMDELFSEINNLKTQITELKLQLGAAAVTATRGQVSTPTVKPTEVKTPVATVQTQATLSLSKNLTRGLSGDPEVAKLQDHLKAQGYLEKTIPSSGDYGPKTVTAVMALQKALGLEAVGSVGPQTRAALSSNSWGTTWGEAQSISAPQSAVRPGTLPVGCTSTAGYSSITGQPCSTPNVSTSVAAIGTIRPTQVCIPGITTPSIKVVSPNGGETFTAGQQITVTWTSCNLSSSTPINILLYGFSSGTFAFQLLPLLVSGSVDNNGNLLNSGSAVFVLPVQGFGSQNQWYQMQSGNYYKIYIEQTVSSSGVFANDYSDNLFTINNSTLGTPTLTQVCIPGITAPWIKVTSPNGGETYTAGQQITVRWKSCNYPTNQPVWIELDAPSYQLGQWLANSTDDGVELVTLPSVNTWPNIVFGNNFKVRLVNYSNGNPEDYSDNLFTIN